MIDAYSEIRTSLSTLQDIARTAGNSALAERADGLKKSIYPRDFRVAFIGEFKAGKTTLVNGLCRRELLPVSTRECTAVVTRIRSTKKDEKEGVTLTLENGKRKDADVEQLDSALSIKGGTVFKNKKVEEAEIRLANWPWSDLNVEMVDTPGVNAAAKARDRTVLKYLPTADALVFVTRADQLLSETELYFLKNNVVREDLTKLFLVINRADVLSSAAEVAEVESRARKLLASVVNGEVRVLFTSAQDYQDGLEDGDKELAQQSGVPAFEQTLRTFLRDERLSAELQAYRRSAKVMVDELIRNFSRIETSAGLGVDRIKERGERYDRAITAIRADKETLKGEVRDLVNSLVKGPISGCIEDQCSILSNELKSASASENVEADELATIARNRMRSAAVAIEGATRRGVANLKQELEKRIRASFAEASVNLDVGVPELSINNDDIQLGHALRVDTKIEEKKVKRVVHEGATEGLAVLGLVVGALTGGIGAIILGGLAGGAVGSSVEREYWDVEQTEKQVVKGIPQTLASARTGFTKNADILLGKVTEGQISIVETIFTSKINELSFERRQIEDDDPSTLEIRRREASEQLKTLGSLSTELQRPNTLELA